MLFIIQSRSRLLEFFNLEEIIKYLNGNFLYKEIIAIKSNDSEGCELVNRKKRWRNKKRAARDIIGSKTQSKLSYIFNRNVSTRNKSEKRHAMLNEERHFQRENPHEPPCEFALREPNNKCKLLFELFKIQQISDNISKARSFRFLRL